ncbi:hypothetical protein C8N36_1454 [Pelagimonas varians]|uniref:Uncharacterized protein n=1 Tax=Pelagimonas varians TaxID=696760 RepID=A0A238L7A3_9RHOB|nr:hypothetical protein C8N36_1454 [Pelagimonas varians]SMX50720.1 hypothetical protein PEV8663_04778 [Pelagimonas varians]
MQQTITDVEQIMEIIDQRLHELTQAEGIDPHAAKSLEALKVSTLEALGKLQVRT